MAPTPLRWAYAGRDESKHGVQCVLAGDEVLCEEEGDLTTLGKIDRLPPHTTDLAPARCGVGTSQVAVRTF